jgi:hypothetical protein
MKVLFSYVGSGPGAFCIEFSQVYSRTYSFGLRVSRYGITLYFARWVFEVVKLPF